MTGRDPATPFDDPHEVERARCAWSAHAREAQWAASARVVSRLLSETWPAVVGFDDEAATRAHRAIADNADLDVPPEVATRTRRTVLAYATEPVQRRDARHDELAAYHARRVRETLVAALDATADALMTGCGAEWLEWPAVVAASYAHAALAGGDWHAARERLAEGVRACVIDRATVATRPRIYCGDAPPPGVPVLVYGDCDRDLNDLVGEAMRVGANIVIKRVPVDLDVYRVGGAKGPKPPWRGRTHEART